jgi:hypothetical protein
VRDELRREIEKFDLVSGLAIDTGKPLAEAVDLCRVRLAHR